MDMKRVEEITDKFYEWDHNLTEEEQDFALKTIKQQHERIAFLEKANADLHYELGFKHTMIQTAVEEQRDKIKRILEES